jgi:hypothetical protein
MPETATLPTHRVGELGRAVIANLDSERQQIAVAKRAVIDLLREAGEAGPDLHLRDQMLRRHDIPPECTLAALRELTGEGKVEIGTDYRYHLKQS